MSSHAADALGDVVFVELPDVGSEVVAKYVILIFCVPILIVNVCM